MQEQPIMMSAKPSFRYRAASMGLAAYLDDRHVEMHIVTDQGESLAIVCPRDSILAVQHHIERLGQDCPEIAHWGRDPGLPAATGHSVAMIVA
jgi:hypothetical protein